MTRGRHDGPRDPAMLARLEKAAKLGLTYALCAQYAGISERSFYSWRRLGREGSPDHVEFARIIDDAEAACAVACMARIHAAAGDPARWQAAAWVMERRYGYVARTEITGAGGGPIEVSAVAELTDDALDREIEDLDREATGLRLITQRDGG